MLEFLLHRKYLKEEYTIGNLYYRKGEGEWEWLCNTLEDKTRDMNKDGDLDDSGEEKVYGKTSIPYGRYYFTLTHSPKFGMITPLLHDVKHFTYIRIHRGWTAKNTEGCILVGKNTAVGRLTESEEHFDKLMALLDENKQRKYTIEIV